MRLEQRRITEVLQFLEFLVSGKAECVTSLHGNKSVPQTQGKYHAEHYGAPPFRSSILIWNQKFSYRSIVEIQSRSEKPSISSERMSERQLTFLIVIQKTLLRKAKRRLVHPRSSV